MLHLNILMTGAGAPGARGTEYALRKGAESQGVRLRIIATDKNPAVAARGFCDAIHTVPSPSHPDYGPSLAALCLKEDIAAIVPQTTMEIEWLARNHLPSCNVPVLVNSEAAIHIANSKTRTALVFSNLGLGAPRFFATSSRQEFLHACSELGYPDQPVVVKIPVSNGMRGLRILRADALSYSRFASEKPSGTECSLEDMLRIIESAPLWPELMVSEFLEGDEYSVDCYSGRSGHLAIPRRRDSIRTGISFLTTLERDEEMIHSCLTAAQHIGLSGVYGFQFKKRGGIARILECNPRVQGTMIASLASDNNIIWAAVADLLPHLLEPVKLNPAWTEGRCYRYWGAVLEAHGTCTIV